MSSTGPAAWDPQGVRRPGPWAGQTPGEREEGEACPWSPGPHLCGPPGFWPSHGVPHSSWGSGLTATSVSVGGVSRCWAQGLVVPQGGPAKNQVTPASPGDKPLTLGPPDPAWLPRPPSQAWREGAGPRGPPSWLLEPDSQPGDRRGLRGVLQDTESAASDRGASQESL